VASLFENQTGALGLKSYIKKLGLHHSLKGIRFDLLRMKARIGLRSKYRRISKMATIEKLHLGCGKRKVSGWLNMDITNSDLNIDFSEAKLPFPDKSVKYIVSQHMIEHLYYYEEFIPLISEMARVLEDNGEVWLSCPDLEKVVVSYQNYKCTDLISDKLERFPDAFIPEPSQHFINILFHQEGSHKNLYDFDMLEYAAIKGGFSNVERVDEKEFLLNFPEFPKRGDDHQSIYVRISK